MQRKKTLNEALKGSGIDKVMKALKEGETRIVDAAKRGLLKASLDLVARAKALAPIAPREMLGGNLQNSITTEGFVREEADRLWIRVGANAWDGPENYGLKTHENMKYEGPDVGGSRTMGLGPRTKEKAKHLSPIEPTDGKAGGKYLERPLRNRPERYVNVISKEIERVLA